MDKYPEIVGSSAAVARMKDQIGAYAPIDLSVLVRGESGSGKELVAAALHTGSARARRPYIAVNCAALPRELLESELFGCEPGAFTGARKRDGYVARADRGTLFLDEIGELSLSAQAVLLRVLETGEFTPVGGERARRADFRLICATHRDLQQMVRAGTFRLDLYHRICSLVVDVPPLRERMGDLPALVRHFLGPDGPTVTRQAFGRLAAHSWPGNVRELKNVIMRARALRKREDLFDVIDVEQVQIDHIEPAPTPAVAAQAVTLSADNANAVRRAVGQLIADEVERHAGNIRAAARALGVSHTMVYRHLRAAENGRTGRI